jgi:hypothetical protein
MSLNLDAFTLTECIRCHCLMGVGDPELVRSICAECRAHAAEDKLLQLLRDSQPPAEPEP